MKPICVPCQRFYRPKQNGRYFIEGMPVGSTRPEPGVSQPELWKPYKLWAGDEWECRGCGSTIIVGVASTPQSEHFKDDFRTAVASFCPDKYQVNDC